MGLVFEWDASKAASNLSKHDVAFAEALTIFADPLAKIFDDPDHSAEEEREIIVGHSLRQGLLVVSLHSEACVDSNSERKEGNQTRASRL